MHGQPPLLAQRLVWPDLVVERKVGRDLLGELGCVGDLALLEVAVADNLRTRRLTTAGHIPASERRYGLPKPALCSTIAYDKR